MSLFPITRRTQAIIACSIAAALILVPNIAVRILPIEWLRPAYYALDLAFILFMVPIALLVEKNTRPSQSMTTSQKAFVYIAAAIILVVGLRSIVSAYRIAADLSDHWLYQTPYRSVEATITARTQLPGAFIVGDDLVLDNTLAVTYPFSDMPSVGQRYRFVLLPTENVVVSYEPAH
jgi:putative effector of murein hydrolase LrgA (UPF0299 family)